MSTTTSATATLKWFLRNTVTTPGFQFLDSKVSVFENFFSVPEFFFSLRVWKKCRTIFFRRNFCDIRVFSFFCLDVDSWFETLLGWIILNCIEYLGGTRPDKFCFLPEKIIEWQNVILSDHLEFRKVMLIFLCLGWTPRQIALALNNQYVAIYKYTKLILTKCLYRYLRFQSLLD